MSTEFQGGVLAELTRNGLVESIHSGHLIMLNADGTIHKIKGNVDLPIFPRSTVKCMQASAMVRSGLKLEPRLLALAEASHSGAAMHQEAVLEILKGAGLQESDLQCSLDKPLGDAERRQDAGQAHRQHGLAGAGRPREQQVVPASCSDGQRAFGVGLAAYLAEIRSGCSGWLRSGTRRIDQRLPAHVRAYREQVARRYHGCARNASRLRGVGGRQYLRAAGLVAGERGWQAAGDWSQLAIEPQLAQKLETRERLRI